MFFFNGNPSSQGFSYSFASVTDNKSDTQYVYSPEKRSCTSLDPEEYHRKLDRILDLLQEQQYSELHKLVGTMTLQEVASFMSKSTRTIERRIEKGMLKAVAKDGNADLFLKKDVVQLYVAEYKKWPKRMP